mmetsp:Transcript_102867/g.291377  ORF Transcript_102867/g.291377 Transcript_102867/m.291377 type:complete len:437 (-) Transcript_102867:25-1335(-)
MWPKLQTSSDRRATSSAPARRRRGARDACEEARRAPPRLCAARPRPRPHEEARGGTIWPASGPSAARSAGMGGRCCPAPPRASRQHGKRGLGGTAGVAAGLLLAVRADTCGAVGEQGSLSGAVGAVVGFRAGGAVIDLRAGTVGRARRARRARHDADAGVLIGTHRAGSAGDVATERRAWREAEARTRVADAAGPAGEDAPRARGQAAGAARGGADPVAVGVQAARPAVRDEYGAAQLLVVRRARRDADAVRDALGAGSAGDGATDLRARREAEARVRVAHAARPAGHDAPGARGQAARAARSGADAVAVDVQAARPTLRDEDGAALLRRLARDRIVGVVGGLHLAVRASASRAVGEQRGLGGAVGDRIGLEERRLVLRLLGPAIGVGGGRARLAQQREGEEHERRGTGGGRHRCCWGSLFGGGAEGARGLRSSGS